MCKNPCESHPQDWAEGIGENLDRIKDLIFCDTIVRKPLGAPQPDSLPWEEIVPSSQLFKKQEDNTWLSIDGSVNLALYQNAIYLSPVRAGGRKARKIWKKRSLRLLELLLMDYYGVSCRVRFVEKPRVYIACFGK